MRGSYLVAGSAPPTRRWATRSVKNWAARLLLGVAVGLLVGLPTLGQSDDDPLAISISASSSSSGQTAYTHVLVVSWTVTGGTGPYQVLVAVTGPDGVQTVETEEPLVGTREFPLVYPEGGIVLVAVEVSDEAGARVSGSSHTILTPTTVGKPGIETGFLPCAQMAFSIEEDFVTRGPTPPDGNPIISDGDLLGAGCTVCARNRDLLAPFDVTVDLGLDAVDILDAGRSLIAFSTELDSPHLGQFSAGDLLFTNGAIIPNEVLLFAFGLQRQDLGLDAVHFVGNIDRIVGFVDETLKMGAEYWARDGALQATLRQYDIDIWFSTEGTAPYPMWPAFLDGDLLSARDGIIVARNSVLLPSSVQAGIPSRGVDFGLDAVTAKRMTSRESIHFSTELLYSGIPGFSDGDVLLILNGVIYTNDDLIRCFEPATRFLGLDALFIEEPR